MSDGQINNDLQQDYELSEEQIRGYQQDGHILLRNVASSAVIDEYRPVIADEVRRRNYQNRPMEERDTYGKAFIQITNVWEQNEAVQRFIFARRFAKIAADLMGVSGVRIYHDQALFKEPGGGHTPWHQDQIYWPLDTNHTITLWMPLANVSEQVGSMTFVSGAHTRGYISRLEISDQSHKTLKQYIEHNNLPTMSYGAMAAGDATFHSGWTLHSAPGNPTESMREIITIIYMADKTVIAEPDSKARANDLSGWLPGKKPGEYADSHMNPLLFSRD